MILKLYRQLESIAAKGFEDIIVDTEVIYSHTGRARKLRLHLIDETFVDVWYSGDGDYSYHWEQRELRNAIYRHDNAPDRKWNHLRSFPKHCHDGAEENVIESNLSDKPEDAFRQFLRIVQGRL